MTPRYARLYAFAYPETGRRVVVGSSSVVGSAVDYRAAAARLLQACGGADRVEVWPSGSGSPSYVLRGGAA